MRVSWKSLMKRGKVRKILRTFRVTGMKWYLFIDNTYDKRVLTLDYYSLRCLQNKQNDIQTS